MSTDLMTKRTTEIPHCSIDKQIYMPEGISLKKGESGADISNLDYRIQATFPDVIDVWERYGYDEPVITSGNDGKHTSPKSLHYKDLAIDIRGRDIPDADLTKMAGELQKRLGRDYVVLAEFHSDPNKDHIHIQWRQK